MKKKAVDSIDAWRGNACQLEFGAGDHDLIDNVLCVVPELRVTASLGLEARRRGIEYPIRNVRQLTRLLGKDRIRLHGHQVNARTVAEALPTEWFPIAHEGELLGVIHLGLRRCMEEARARRLAELKSVSERGVRPSNRRTRKGM